MSPGSVRASESKRTSESIAGAASQDYNEVREDFQKLVEEVGKSIDTYCRRRPQMAGLMIFALGFYVGWKVKPW